MSAMAKMFADMILKEIPEDIRNQLTPENMNNVMERVSQFLTFVKTSQEYQIKALNAHTEMLEEILEKVSGNDDSSSSGEPAPVRTRARRGKQLPAPDGSGGGSDSGDDGSGG